MFQGIDPEGLDSLADTLETQTVSLRHQTRIALDALYRNQRGGDAAAIGALLSRVEEWGIESSAALRWRTAMIQSGQDARLDIFRLARARFAAEAVFSLGTVEDEYLEWVERLQASRRRVGEAVSNISGWLDQGWTDWDVTNGDLHNIRRTLEALSGDELDLVIAALSLSQLERWIEEMGNSVNGFSRSEKQGVFSLLAANSSGESLDRVHNAILASGGSQDAFDLGMKIHRVSPDQVILDFIEGVIGRGLTERRYSGLAAALAAGGIEDTETVNRMLRAVTSEEADLRLIVVDCLVITQNHRDRADAPPGPLDFLVDAIVRADDPELKAAAFAALAAMATDSDSTPRGLLRDRHRIFDTTTTDNLGRPERSRIATEMLLAAESGLLSQATAILVSDTNEVVQQLATNLDPDGLMTTRYLYGLIDQDEIGLVGKIVGSLRSGPVVDPVSFSTLGVDPAYQYPHAQNLGFMAGSLRRALERYADDQKTAIKWIANGAKSATIAVGVGFMKALEGLELAGVAIEGTADWISTDYWASRTQDEIDKGLDTLLDTVTIAMQPALSPTGGPPRLGDALQWWKVRYDITRNR